MSSPFDVSSFLVTPPISADDPSLLKTSEHGGHPSSPVVTEGAKKAAPELDDPGGDMNVAFSHPSLQPTVLANNLVGAENASNMRSSVSTQDEAALHGVDLVAFDPAVPLHVPSFPTSSTSASANAMNGALKASVDGGGGGGGAAGQGVGVDIGNMNFGGGEAWSGADFESLLSGVDALGANRLDVSASPSFTWDPSGRLPPSFTTASSDQMQLALDRPAALSPQNDAAQLTSMTVGPRPTTAADRSKTAAHPSAQLQSSLSQYAALYPTAVATGRRNTADSISASPGPALNQVNQRVLNSVPSRAHSRTLSLSVFGQPPDVLSIATSPGRPSQSLSGADAIRVSGRGTKRGSGLLDAGGSPAPLQMNDPKSYPFGVASTWNIVGPSSPATAVRDTARLTVNSSTSPDLIVDAGASAAIQRDVARGGSLPGFYSSSGFDVVSILARVQTRPNRRIAIGPVDMSCSFVVSDARQPDLPIVYVSDTFTRLTGYQAPEVIGKGCRFLQAPDGQVAQGSRRRYTDNAACHHLKKHLASCKEVQASLINYKRNGNPFINLVTIIPVSMTDGGDTDFFIGFQVDLVEQPSSILKKMDDGSYTVNYSNVQPPVPPLPAPPAAVKSDPVSEGAPASDVVEMIGSGVEDHRQWSRIFLEQSHDVICVLSLKGSFLYVSPSAKRVLEYDPTEMIGKSISEICHPSDIVPIMRELKDSTSNATISATTAAASAANAKKAGPGPHGAPGGRGQGGPTVDLLFRIRRKFSGYVWIECQGKLHLETGKGRKCVVLAARERPVYRIAREEIRKAGGLGDREFWAKLSFDGLYLNATSAVKGVLGYTPAEMVGTSLYELVQSDLITDLRRALQHVGRAQYLTTASVAPDAPVLGADTDGWSDSRLAHGRLPFGPSGRTSLRHRLRNKEGKYVDVITTFYPSGPQSMPDPTFASQAEQNVNEPKQTSVICQSRVVDSVDPSVVQTAESAAQTRRLTLPFIGAPALHMAGRRPSLDDRPLPMDACRRAPSLRYMGYSGHLLEEIDVTKSTSWQFELHSLKLANKKLKEELAALGGLKIYTSLHPLRNSSNSGSSSASSSRFDASTARTTPSSGESPEGKKMTPP